MRGDLPYRAETPMRYHTGMSGKTVAYLCECGKKWVFEEQVLTGDHAVHCECGRTIVIHDGEIYSPKGN